MMANSLRITIRSKKVPVRAVNFSVRCAPINGQFFSERRSMLSYDYMLDEQEEKALREAATLAKRCGLRLQVVDLTRERPAKRIVRSIANSSLSLARSLRPGNKRVTPASSSRQSIISTASSCPKSGRWDIAK